MKAFLKTTLLLSFCMIDQLSSGCNRPPVVTGYSRPHGVLVSTYNLTWQPASCNVDNIFQYKIQFVESCTTTQPLTIQTGNNKTTALIVVPSCANTGCYLRICAQLSDSSHTEYSPCMLINDTFVEHKITVGQQRLDVCITIQGVCSSGSPTQFYINGQSISRPQSNMRPYNLTYSFDLGTYSFCFRNVTDDAVLIEYCYQAHLASCPFCPANFGEVEFLSRAELLLHDQEVDNTDQERSIPDDSITKPSKATYSDSYTFSTPFNSTTSTNFLDGYFLVIFITGAVFVGITCMIILTGISTAICCHKIKKANNIKIGNVYDEPTLPDPIYQELKVKDATNIDMTGNDSYGRIIVIMKDELHY